MVVLEGLLAVVACEACDVQVHENTLHTVEGRPNVQQVLEMVHNPSNLVEAEGHGN